MSVIRYESVNALAEYLRDYLDTTPVLVGQQDNDQPGQIPAVVLIPGQYSFTPFQAIELDGSYYDNHTLIKVGDLEGEVEIRVVAKYPAQREALEESIFQAFLANPMTPGNVNVQLGDVEVNGVEFPPQLVASYDLQDALWHEEQVFTAPRYSYMTVDVTMSALTTADYPNIDHLQVALNHDLDSDTPVETVEIDQDGNLTPE